jgi:hypothetical protein
VCRCGAACCAGDLTGTFSPDNQSKLPGALQWQPQPASNQSCSYHQYTALEVTAPGVTQCRSSYSDT